MRALSIRQPYAEQILRGIKRFEYRSRPTAIRGKKQAPQPVLIDSAVEELSLFRFVLNKKLRND